MKENPYSNHVILRGLDEARAHQRGESVGLSPYSRIRPLGADGVVGRGPVALTPLLRYNSLTPEERIAIALESGKPEEVAKRNGIEASKVIYLRRLLRGGQLQDSFGEVARAPEERTKRGRKPTDPALTASVAAEIGTAREVAERLGVSMAFVYKCRGRANGTY